MQFTMWICCFSRLGQHSHNSLQNLRLWTHTNVSSLVTFGKDWVLFPLTNTVFCSYSGEVKSVNKMGKFINPKQKHISRPRNLVTSEWIKINSILKREKAMHLKVLLCVCVCELKRNKVLTIQTPAFQFSKRFGPECIKSFVVYFVAHKASWRSLA